MPGTKRIITVAETPQETTIIKEIAVQSVYPSRLIYIGVVSGKEYEWKDAGSIVMVLAEDVPNLIEKRIGKGSCCGAVSQDGNKVFEIVKQQGGNNA